MSITAELSSLITTTIGASGYWAVGILMALESACLPVPSEVVMPFAGYLASLGHMNLFMAATVGAIGCNVGSTAAYLAGAYGGRPFVDKWGRYILLTRAEVDRVDRFFGKYGSAAVFTARLLPIVRSFISLPAGMARMPFVRFQVYSFAGSWPWCFALTYIGFKLGEAWQKNPRLETVMHAAHLAIAAGLLALISFYLFRKIRKIQKEN